MRCSAEPASHSNRINLADYGLNSSSRYQLSFVRGAPVTLTQEQGSDYRLTADHLRLSLLSREEGIDVSGVDAFIASKGLIPRPALILAPEDVPNLKQGLARLYTAEAIQKRFAEMPAGTHLLDLGVTYIIRSLTAERLSGAVITEGHLVHEKLHASSDYPVRARFSDGSENICRLGFEVYHARTGERRGGFLEEGSCELLRGEYAATRHGPDLVKRLQATLSNRELTCADSTLITTLETGEVLQLPAKYVYFSENGNRTSSSTVFAGLGLEVLCSQRKGLKELLLGARSDPNLLREVPRAINSLGAGLYSDLMKLPPTFQGCVAGYKLILDVVFGGEPPLDGNNCLVLNR